MKQRILACLLTLSAIAAMPAAAIAQAAPDYAAIVSASSRSDADRKLERSRDCLDQMAQGALPAPAEAEALKAGKE